MKHEIIGDGVPGIKSSSRLTQACQSSFATEDENRRVQASKFKRVAELHFK